MLNHGHFKIKDWTFHHVVQIEKTNHQIQYFKRTGHKDYQTKLLSGCKMFFLSPYALQAPKKVSHGG